MNDSEAWQAEMIQLRRDARVREEEAYRLGRAAGFEAARMLAITAVNVRVPLAEVAARNRAIAALQAMEPPA